MNRYIVGKTDKCIVSKCGKDAVHYDGVVLKSRDAVIAGFCEHHWFIVQCPNSFKITGCFGTYDKSMGLK